MNNKEALQMIKGVANRIANYKPDTARELQKIAQFLESENSQTIQPFSSENTMAQSSFQANIMPNDAYSTPVGQSHGHPDIEPFVNMKVEQPDVDDRAIHTLTLTLRAPHDISEAEMMNYMLGMGEKLGVDIDGFKWTKNEPKGSKTV